MKYKKYTHVHNGKHIKFWSLERLKDVPLLFLLFLYITKIRETASSSFERAVTNRKRV